MTDTNGEVTIRNLEGRQAIERDDDGGRGKRKSTEIP